MSFGKTLGPPTILNTARLGCGRASVPDKKVRNHQIRYKIGNSNTGNFESVIRCGELTLLETDRKVTLSALDHLTLGTAKSRRLELSKADNDNSVQAIFEGSVSKILVGTKDFRDNLTSTYPTYLQYLFHQQGLKLFWGALVFLIGVVWKIRRTIFS